MHRGAARIFLRGGWSKLWKQKPWKGKIACDKNSQGKHVICRKTIDCTHHKNWGSFQLTAILFLWYSFLTIAKLDKLDYMSQPSFVLIYDLFSTVGKHISRVQVSFIFAKFNKHIKLICAKFVFFRFFPIFMSWFYQHTKGLSWQHQVQTRATHHLQSDPSWISLQANHLNSPTIALPNVASGSLCVPHENRM